jgi:hypothetical protein
MTIGGMRNVITVSRMDRKEPSGPQPIAGAIRQFLAESGLSRTRGDERVLRAWSDAAGPSWKVHASPVRFRDGHLTVQVGSSVALAELRSFHAEKIRTRANASLGRDVIQKVTFELERR